MQWRAENKLNEIQNTCIKHEDDEERITKYEVYKQLF